MSDIDYLEQLPKTNSGGVSAENNFTLSEDGRSALDEESKIKLIELLKHEDAATVSEIVSRFKSGDKEAAEILVRTFYPYVEGLLVALEKRDLQERASERVGIAPALISSGGRRREFLSSFFVDFVNKAAEADFSKGIRLYLYSHCVDTFSKRMQNSLDSSKSSGEDNKEIIKSYERSLFLDDEPNHNASSSGNYKAQDHMAENKSSLFFEDIPKPKMRISGIPAARSSSNKENVGGKDNASNQNVKVGGVKGPVYMRQSDSLSGSIAARSAEVRRLGLGANTPSSRAQLVRSDSNGKTATTNQRTSRNNVHLAPALSPSEDVPEKEAAPSAVVTAQPQLTRKAQILIGGLKKLATTDIEAYRTVVMRYFANCSFAELCQKLEVTSAGEIGLRLLRGLLSLGGDQRSA